MRPTEIVLTMVVVLLLLSVWLPITIYVIAKLVTHAYFTVKRRFEIPNQEISDGEGT